MQVIVSERIISLGKYLEQVEIIINNN